MKMAALNAVSNRADWIETYKIIDDETNEAISLAAATEITVEVRDRETCSVLLSATLTGGSVTHIETGVFQWTFTVTQMRTLCAKTYDVGLTILKDGITTQILIGTLPVHDGIVS